MIPSSCISKFGLISTYFRPLSFVNDAAPNLTATSASKDTQQCLAALGALINEDSATSVVSLLRDASTAVNLAAIQILT